MLLIGLWLCTLSVSGTVTMDGQTWKELQEPTESAAVEESTVSASRRKLTVWADGDSTRIRAIWTLNVSGQTVVSKRWIREPLQEASILVDGRRVLLRANDGLWASFSLGPGTHTVVLEGLVSRPLGLVKQTLSLADAAISEVEVRTDEEAVVEAATSVRLGDRIWTSGSILEVSTRPKEQKKARKQVILGSVGVGMTVGESSATGRARVRLKVQSGSISSVELDVSGLGTDLQVTGTGVVSWRQDGRRLLVELGRDESYLVELDLNWSQALKQGDNQAISLPQISPRGVLRTVSTLQVARDGEVEVLPEVRGGSPVSSRELKEWGTGLVTGTSTASYAFSGSVNGELRVLRFSPVSGPPTLVDVATITVAATDEGRGLMRAHYAVRNDRSAHLRIAPPPGATLVSARVAGRSVALGRDGEVLLVPLEKSVETVQGLLAFPVEVGFLLDNEAWNRRERRSVDLPRVNAPVAVTRSTLVLPPGYADRGEDLSGRVDEFVDGTGIQYGLGTGDSARSEVLMQNAVDAWMANDFNEAQGYLDTLRDEGLADENTIRLQSNLDVITGKGEGEYDVTLERRVRQQARARADEDRREQDKVLKKAEKAKNSGDYETASRAYEQALDIGVKLDMLEEEESVEFAELNDALMLDLQMAQQEAVEARELDEIFLVGEEPGQIIESFSGSAQGQVAREVEDFDLGGMLQSDLTGGTGGLIGAKGVQDGAGGLGTRGSGLGGGGSAEGLGGLGTKGRGSGSSGYGSGGGNFGSAAPPSAAPTQEAAPPPPPSASGSLILDRRTFDDTPTTGSLDAMQVTSVQNTTVVPVIGAPVRFEHRLLPPDEALHLDVFAIFSRRSQ